MYVFSGSITHNISGEMIQLSEGEIIILGRGTKHSVEPSGDADLGVNLIIATEVWEDILSGIRKTAEVDTSPFDAMLKHGDGVYLLPNKGNSPSVSWIMDGLIHSAIVTNQPRYILKETLVLLLCHLIGKQAERGRGDGKKQRLLEYIKNSYSTASLSEAAKLFGLSEPYLSRWVSREFDASFKELVMAERFRAACDLLSRSDMPIGEIVEACGFTDNSNFSRTFKQTVGITPTQFKKKYFFR
jgi:AraC-like DNA-binding protein